MATVVSLSDLMQQLMSAMNSISQATVLLQTAQQRRDAMYARYELVTTIASEIQDMQNNVKSICDNAVNVLFGLNFQHQIRLKPSMIQEVYGFKINDFTYHLQAIYAAPSGENAFFAPYRFRASDKVELKNTGVATGLPDVVGLPDGYYTVTQAHADGMNFSVTPIIECDLSETLEIILRKR